MESAIRTKYYYSLVNAFIYGLAKTEIELIGRNMAITRMSIESISEMFFKQLEEWGLKGATLEDPFDKLEDQIQLLGKAGLIDLETLGVEREENKMNFTVKKCSYALGCNLLIQDGIRDFPCMRGIALLVAARKSYPRLRLTNVNQPGNCKFTIERR